MSGGNSGVKVPVLPGFFWRPLELSDAPALHTLQKECASFAYSPPPKPFEKLYAEMENAARTLPGDSLCAADADGRLAAAAWITLDDGFRHELRAYLADCVHPSWGQEVNVYLIKWMEARARVRFAGWEDTRPRILRLDVEHQDRKVFRLYESLGYHFTLAEETMRRPLDGTIPEYALPAEMGVVPWSAERAELFHKTYLAAFRDRPGFPAWGLETWRKAFTESEGFRQDLSLLVLDGTVGAAYAVCMVEDNTGWVLQFGVNTDYRRRGLGAGLLAELLRRFRKAGLAEAALEVNVNNETARRLYIRMGFAVTSVYSSFRKTMPI